MSIGGPVYKRSKSIGYTPGSHYQRFGKLGLHQSRNMSAMNREAVSNYINSFSAAGSNMFAQKMIESQGLSEIAAQRLLQRVKAEMAGSTVNTTA